MPQKTKTRRSGPISNRLFWSVFAILTVAFYFFGLTIPLVGPDESRYAEVAREMFERGDWITPTLGGFNWFEKPALLYWLEIVSYHIFGVNEFAARFGSALFGLGTILTLWLLARCAVHKGHLENAEFANWVGLIAASTLGLIVFSRGASFDIVVTFPITASLVGFFIYDHRNDLSSGVGKNVALVSFYFFSGLALLAKGLIGIVFPFAIVGSYFLFSWRAPRRSFIFSLVWGLPVIAAVAAIWYLPMYLQHGHAFIDEFFIQHHFQRFITNKYQHPQPFYFFIWVLPLMTIPWLPFFIASIWNGLKRLFGFVKPNAVAKTTPANAGASDPLGHSLRIFVYAWLLFPLVFFSFSGSKLPGYILPSVPAAILITADYVCRFVQKSKARQAVPRSLALATYVVILFALVFIVPGFARKESVKELIDTANARGYSSLPVASFLTVSNNAEFYAAGRIVRDEEGKQRKFIGQHELLDYIQQRGGEPVVVLVPLEHLKSLTGSDLLRTIVLNDNGELAIVVVSAR